MARLAPEVPAFGAGLYGVAYQPTSGNPPSSRGSKVHGSGLVQIWTHPLVFGQSLPSVPLWLLNGPCVRVDLEAVYQRTLYDLRMIDDLPPVNGAPPSI